VRVLIISGALSFTFTENCLRAEEPTDAAMVFFESRVRPLLAERCYKCHSQRADKHEGGLRLDSR